MKKGLQRNPFFVKPEGLMVINQLLIACDDER